MRVHLPNSIMNNNDNTLEHTTESAIKCEEFGFKMFTLGWCVCPVAYGLDTSIYILYSVQYSHST